MVRRIILLLTILVAITSSTWAGSVTLLPSTLSFGKHAIGTTSTTKKVVLTNAQTVALRIISITVPFGFTQTNTCGALLTPFTACAIYVRFRPKLMKQYTGKLVEIDNGS